MNFPSELADLQITDKKALLHVTKLQKTMQTHLRLEGEKEINYLDKSFIVHQNVFWPFEDSKPLAESMVINPDESVLDLGTGSGVLAIMAAYKGAQSVLAVDINHDALDCAKKNVSRHKLNEKIQIKYSDVFSNIDAKQQFDVILANLPFRNLPAHDVIEAASWDTDFSVHARFFEGVLTHLKSHGRIYLAQANYGPLKELQALLHKYGFNWKLINQAVFPNEQLRIFYVFEITPIA